jgi:hypothetical protein
MSATNIGADLFGDLANAAKSIVRGIAVPPANSSFGFSLRASSRDLVEIDPVGVLANAVLHRAEVAAGDRDVPAVGQVTARGQAQAHHGVAGLEEREVDREVRGRAGVRLDVRVLGAEQRLGAIDAELLDLIDVLLALVVALAWIALAVLVGQHGAGGGEHRTGDVVLGGDQPDLVALAALLGGDQLGDFGIDSSERGLQGGMHGSSNTTGAT